MWEEKDQKIGKSRKVGGMTKLQGLKYQSEAY